jgi:hypothetical protein
MAGWLAGTGAPAGDSPRGHEDIARSPAAPDIGQQAAPAPSTVFAAWPQAIAQRSASESELDAASRSPDGAISRNAAKMPARRRTGAF